MTIGLYLLDRNEQLIELILNVYEWHYNKTRTGGEGGGAPGARLLQRPDNKDLIMPKTGISFSFRLTHPIF